MCSSRRRLPSVPRYDNALAYTYYTYLEHVLDGTPHPDNMTRVRRAILFLSPLIISGSLLFSSFLFTF